MSAQKIAMLRANDIILICVALILLFEVRKLQVVQILQTFTIEICDGATVLDPFWQNLQLRVENSCLKIVQQARDAMEMIFSTITVFPVVAKKPYAACDFRIVRCDSATIAKATEQLKRIKAGSAYKPKRTGFLLTELGP